MPKINFWKDGIRRMFYSQYDRKYRNRKYIIGIKISKANTLIYRYRD